MAHRILRQLQSAISNQQSAIANAGFTLLELMIVIAITSILATMSVVQFTRISRATQIRLAAENFSSFVRVTENMSRSGVPLEPGARQDCNSDGAVELAPCGGYGVDVSADRYTRFGDVNKSVALSGNPTVEQVLLPPNIRIASTALPTTIVFVPPKDKICINQSSRKKCFPNAANPQAAEAVFTFSIDRGVLQKIVRVNNVSGLVSIE